jgi:hypothetical protein
MKKAKTYLLATSGVVILLGSFLLSVPKASDAQDRRTPQPVTVENGSDKSVPVAVLNRVHVCPDQDCPAMTLNANDRNAFQKSVQISIPKGEASVGVDIPVPRGKRLVIEFVTAQQFTYSAPAGINLRTQVNGDDVVFSLLQTKQSEPNVDLWIATHQMRVYADAPSFHVEATRVTPFIDDAFAEVSVSGYLVDL